MLSLSHAIVISPFPGSLASMDLYWGVDQQCSTTVAKRPNLLQPPSAPPPPSHLTSRQHLFPHSSDPEAGGLLFAHPSRGRGLLASPSGHLPSQTRHFFHLGDCNRVLTGFPSSSHGPLVGQTEPLNKGMCPCPSSAETRQWLFLTGRRGSKGITKTHEALQE